jgi:hypothetical protein
MPALALQRSPAADPTGPTSEDEPTTALTAERPERPAAEAPPDAVTAVARRATEVVTARLSRSRPPDLPIMPIAGRGARAETLATGATSVPVQRAVAGDMPTVHRGEDASREAKQLGARAFTRGAEVYLPGEHGSLDRGPAAALLAHELTHVRQQRQLGSSLPAESSDAGQRLESEARSAEQSYQLPAAMTLPAAKPESASRPAPAGRSPAGRSSAVAETPAGTSRGSDEAGMRAPTAAPPPVVQRAASPPLGGGAPATRADEDLDDLARRLYDRLRSRLHRELLVDRERSGMVTDLR